MLQKQDDFQPPVHTPRSSLPQFSDGKLKRAPLTEQEYQQFKLGLPTWKHIMVAKFLRATGLRISEALRTQRRHLQLDGPVYVVWVKRGKQTGKEKDSYDDIYLNPEFALELRHFLDGNGVRPSDPIFSGRKDGASIDRSTIRKAFNKAGEETIGRPVSPHELRKLYSSSLLNQNVPLVSVSRMLGHADTRTTARHYYDMSADMRRVIGETVRP